MIELPQLRARIDRINSILRGLAKETLIIQKGCDPFLYLERQAYLAALREAVAGLEAARVALAQAAQRLDPSTGD